MKYITKSGKIIIYPNKWHTNRLYRIWCLMKSRCNNPNSKEYKYYGMKGIKVCKEWNKFNNFKNDMENGYKNNLTLDRIDNLKGYFKENCRWATWEEQENNRTNNKFIFFNGMKKTLNQWSRFLGIKRSTLSQRYYVYKWDINKCFTFGG